VAVLAAAKAASTFSSIPSFTRNRTSRVNG